MRCALHFPLLLSLAFFLAGMNNLHRSSWLCWKAARALQCQADRPATQDSSKTPWVVRIKNLWPNRVTVADTRHFKAQIDVGQTKTQRTTFLIFNVAGKCEKRTGHYLTPECGKGFRSPIYSGVGRGEPSSLL